MKPALLLAIIASLVFPGLSRTAGADERTDQAVSAAKSWLALVDSRQYRESWEAAARFFKEKVSRDDWVKMVAPVRNPLGDVQSRDLIGAQYTTLLPGAPPGEYVFMQFRTAFQNKPDAIETVTPMLDDHGAWRVSGYYIK